MVQRCTHEVLEHETRERQRAEEDLKASELKYRTLFESSPDAILMLERGKYLDCNRRALDVFKLSSKDELLRTSPNELTLPTLPDGRDSFVAIRQHVETAFAKGTETFEWMHRRKDGSLFPSEVVLSVLKLGDRDILQAIVRDITDRKRAEKERRRLQAQLQQAQKMEAIGTLAGGIAHDFNNLLTGIQGSISLMQLDIPKEHPHYPFIKEMQEIVKRGVNLTRQLLGFARGGKYQVIPTTINALIKKTADMFGRTKKEIAIHEAYGEDTWNVEVDRGQIEQVLLNIFVNAGQAMPDGGDLTIQTKNVVIGESFARPFKVNPGNYVRISIADTGIGMDEAVLGRIFDPFFTTKEKGKGTGLGLASAYGIIRNHGGIIDVVSRKGMGSTFYLYLPASARKVAREKGTPKELLLRGTETILLVDDEQLILNIGKKMLNAMGYKVLLAQGGAEALKRYEEQGGRIDIVILDMIMPGMGGGETFDRLKELYPDSKVVLASGYSIDGQAREILDRGCNGFIQKPFDMKKLTNKIREVLDKSAKQ